MRSVVLPTVQSTTRLLVLHQSEHIHPISDKSVGGKSEGGAETTAIPSKGHLDQSGSSAETTAISSNRRRIIAGGRSHECGGQ